MKKPVYVVCVVFSVFLLLSMLSSNAVAQTANPLWNLRTVEPMVDSNGLNYYGSNSIALDSAGNPHISYYDSSDSGQDLKYASWNGSTWSIQTVDSTDYNFHSINPPKPGYSCLNLDSKGNPHISYVDENNHVLKYASWTGATWKIQTVCSSGDYTSIAVDSSGKPHISYINSGQLEYASWNGSTWSIQIVDSTENVGQYYLDKYSSLALDSHGNPHICYNYANVSVIGTYMHVNNTLKYASWNGSAWNTQAIDTGVDDYISLALDKNGDPHISYVNDGLMYAGLPSSETATGLSVYNLSTLAIILGAVIAGVVVALILVLFFYKKPEPEPKGKVKTAKEEQAVSQDESEPEPEQEQNAKTKETATQPKEEKT
jgi:hypothetical protein